MIVLPNPTQTAQTIISYGWAGFGLVFLIWASGRLAAIIEDWYSGRKK